MTIELFNMDCMDYMAECEDNAFHLAIVDPPYRDENQPDQWLRANSGDMKKWPNAPKGDFFAELLRVSSHQIIWGGNYFTEWLSPNNNWIVWHKLNEGTHFSMCELAWNSIRKNVQLFRHNNAGAKKIHPTQKPVKLYEWLLTNYAKPGQRILDTHLGSGSSAIAAHYFGCDFVGTELDPEYFKAAQARFHAETAQEAMFLYAGD